MPLQYQIINPPKIHYSHPSITQNIIASFFAFLVIVNGEITATNICLLISSPNPEKGRGVTTNQVKSTKWTQVHQTQVQEAENKEEAQQLGTKEV